MSIRFIARLSLVYISLFSVCSFAQFSEEILDATVERALTEFYTPGMSVAVVKDDELIYAKGFGSANLNNKQIVTPNTYFRLASVSKAFTAAALAILVDQEKIRWNDLVVDYLPQFRLQDTYASANFTIEDLLTHKSGLVSGAGDSMIWPEPSGFSREEVVKNLRYLTPDYQFRQTYAYSNVMYITAGEIVEKVSGQAFEAFVDQHIFKSLDMQCFAGDMPQSAVSNSAMGYAHNDDRGIYPISRNAISGEALMSAAAGGMVCNASEMTKWVKALLSKSSLPFSEKQLEKMWLPHTIMDVSKTERDWQGSHFENYGLGWRLTNFGPYKHISHTGTLSGYQAFVALIPELNLGVIVLNNGSNYGARSAVMMTIMDMFIHDNTSDWVQTYVDYQDENEQRYLANFELPKAKSKVSLTAEQIVGQYQDKWFGDFTIYKATKDLRIEFPRFKNLRGKVVPFQDMSYKIIWDNQNAASNAFIHFQADVQRAVESARLHPFTVDEKNNHAWRDMHFIKLSHEQVAKE